MITLLAATIFSLHHQKLEINVDATAGEVISGIHHFQVRVGSDDPITQVEFYVNNELRDSDSSVPYDFNLDTIEEKDGDVQITFAAYSNRGDSAKKEMDLKVDNGVSLGADAHVTKGIDYLSSSNWNDAVMQGRIALKIQPENNRARMLMAKAYLGLGVLDKAEKYAEDWHESDPKDAAATELLSGIDVRKAFSTLSRGSSDRETALKDIQAALKSAIDGRQRLMQERLDAVGQPTLDNLVTYSDAAIAAGRLNLAVNALRHDAYEHLERPELTNRLAYTQLLSGRLMDAYETLKTVERLAKPDAYALALMAVITGVSHDEKLSQAYLDEAIKEDPSNLGVLSAQAYLAQQSGKTDDLAKAVTAMQAAAPDLPETNYYVYVLAEAQGNFDSARKAFQETLVNDPLSEEAYILEGNNYMLFAINSARGSDDQRFRFQSAKAMYSIALEVRPESYHGLVGLALASLMNGDKDDAVTYGSAAVKAAPSQPVCLYVQSAAFSVSGMAHDAYIADRTSWMFDRAILGGRAVPNPMDAWTYYSKYGQIPVMAPPK